MQKPRMWLLAGPNGSGKSTLAGSDIFQRLTRSPETTQTFVSLNADALNRDLADQALNLSPSERNLRAAQTIDRRVDELIEARASFLVETVLSTDKYETPIRRAKASGFWVGLIYVLLNNPTLNVRRVAQRVAQGGHDVPEDKIRDRWRRSLERLSMFARLADAFTVWDNSDLPPALLVEATPDRLYVSTEAKLLIARVETPPELRNALRALGRMV